MPQSFVFVRSADRSFGASSASFKVVLPTTFKNVTGVTLLAAELPYSAYNIDNIYTSGVTFTYNGTSLQLIVPAGNYTVADLTSWLLSTLSSSLPAASVTAVTYSTVSGRITISYSGSSSFSVQSNNTGSLGRVLGTSPLGLVAYGSAGTLVFPCVCNLAVSNTIFMIVGELPSQMISTNNQHATFRLQMSAAQGSVVMHNAASSVFNNITYSSPLNALSTLTVSLVSQDGQAIDLHAAEWCFTILISASS